MTTWYSANYGFYYYKNKHMSIKTRLGERLRSFHLSFPVVVSNNQKPSADSSRIKTPTNFADKLSLPAIKSNKSSSKLLVTNSPIDSNSTSPCSDYLMSPRYSKNSNYLPYIYAQFGPSMPKNYESGLFDDIERLYVPRKESSINMLFDTSKSRSKKKSLP
ncbi:unnamed protein product [Blepharisma stoltei]|uniref:Uncharacterized protein n=1 Tax=Blepharisma stoltei TaxID=1481888 RepID=A0AAU9IVY8_9CILI|nr:unnamed protein product [Blepharisma stoltei]